MKDVSVDYNEKNGLLYPNLQISENPETDKLPLGKYGQMCLNFMQEEYPERYAELRMSGELMPLMHQVNEDAYQQIGTMVQKLIEKETVKSEQFMDKVKLRNTCQVQAEEFVIREFVYQRR